MPKDWVPVSVSGSGYISKQKMYVYGKLDKKFIVLNYPGETLSTKPKKYNDYSELKLVIRSTGMGLVKSTIRRSAQFNRHQKKSVLSMYSFYGSKRRRVSMKQVDSITELIRSGGEFHISCDGGKHRTSFVLYTIDIMFNAQKLSLPEILKRGAKNGNEDFTDFRVFKNGTYSKHKLNARYENIKVIYTYFKKYGPNPKVKFEDWVLKNNVNYPYKPLKQTP